MRRERIDVPRLANDYVVCHEIFSMKEVLDQIDAIRYGEVDASLETKLNIMEEANSWLDYLPDSLDYRYALRNEGQGWHITIVDKSDIQ
jgi:hypothetical protein